MSTIERHRESSTNPPVGPAKMAVMRISAVTGDITTLQVDAIVNTA
ncbi:MAG: hypothetical protein RIE08_18455 [Acidimicrobiales bacterium]